MHHRVKLATAIAIMATAFGALFPAAALASGEGIQVIDDQQMVRFPDGVDFSLVIDSDAEVNQIRLHYRVRGSEVWSYTYATLDSSKPGEAYAKIGTSGTTYLAPGVELEFYYSIHDVNGNVVLTPRRTVSYLDDRYDWESTEIGPLTLIWHDQSQKRVDQVAGQVEANLRHVGDFLGVGSSQRFRGVIYNSHAEARDALPPQSPTLSTRQVFQGFAFGDQGVFVGIGLQTDLIIHESAHLMIRDAMRYSGAPIPVWVNEGFASYMEPGSRNSYRGSTLKRISERLPLRHMGTLPGRPDDIRLFYAKAESVVGYLIEEHGKEKFREFIGLIGAGTRLEPALDQTYGTNADGLEMEWLGAAPTAADSGRRTGTPSPWINSGTTLIGGMVVVVMAVVLLRGLAGRLRRRPEDPDLDYWQEETFR